MRVRRTITKEIPTTVVSAAVYNVETETVRIQDYTLMGKFINDKLVMKALNKALNSKDRLIHVKSITSVINVCFMSLETFLEHSTIEVSKVVYSDEADDGNQDDLSD